MPLLKSAGRMQNQIIKMKVLLTIVFLLTGLFALTQVDSLGLKVIMQKLDKALLEKDDELLQGVLHQDASFGHSNGWIQRKEDVLKDFKSGKLIYSKIENTSAFIVAINKKWATVRTHTNAEGLVNGNAFKLSLHVMQVWIQTKKGWQLLARQSAKL